MKLAHKPCIKIVLWHDYLGGRLLNERGYYREGEILNPLVLMMAQRNLISSHLKLCPPKYKCLGSQNPPKSPSRLLHKKLHHIFFWHCIEICHLWLRIVKVHLVDRSRSRLLLHLKHKSKIVIVKRRFRKINDVEGNYNRGHCIISSVDPNLVPDDLGHWK